jgi:ComF family protein
MKWIGDFISLVFPRICAACGNSLWKHEEIICQSCEFHLPKTNFHFSDENPVTKMFWGRADLVSGAAFLYFNKGNKVQLLVHQLKYNGRKDIGVFLGMLYGQTLKYAPSFNSADVIVPVPLHKKKYMKRGYNQSEQFGVGLGSVMSIPLNRHLLVRTKATETQTRKSRFSRYQNVREIFLVNQPENWRGKHLLLVDDVITTGATMESCIEALRVIPEVKISIAGIATALI